MSKSGRQRSERNWEQDTYITEVHVPIQSEPRNKRVETFRVETITEHCLYEVTSNRGNTWEVQVGVDGKLEVSHPPFISPQNKSRVLEAVKSRLKTQF